MIDLDFITLYTNALYSVKGSNCPSYDEFRDMFSSGQLKSKEWIIDYLKNVNLSHKKILIVGSWFGTLGFMIKAVYPYANVCMLDIDPRCKHFIDNIINQQSSTDHAGTASIHKDMFEHTYTEDIVINTSCEHIHDIEQWLRLIPKGTTVLLQSNNYFAGAGHIDCVSEIAEFRNKLKLNRILYSGELQLPMYTRFMVTGIV